MRTKLRRGDTILVIAGKDRGKTGAVELIVPKTGRVVVAGINAFKKHVKVSPKNPGGGLVTAYRSIDASNVMFVDPETKKPTRLGWTRIGKTSRRLSRLSGKLL